MAFRQQIGPSASSKLLQQLLTLLQAQGYTDYRSARGPLGLTQRQGLGKFTTAEAESLIEQLEAGADDVPPPSAPTPRSAPAGSERPLRDASTEALVAELGHRGWTATRSAS